jgi:hypothetical protein
MLHDDTAAVLVVCLGIVAGGAVVVPVLISRAHDCVTGLKR